MLITFSYLYGHVTETGDSERHPETEKKEKEKEENNSKTKKIIFLKRTSSLLNQCATIMTSLTSNEGPMTSFNTSSFFILFLKTFILDVVSIHEFEVWYSHP